jgi:hypothetical protein
MEDYKELIKFAKNDYGSAKILLEKNILNNSLFHCQQCLEKLMKSAYIFIFNEEITIQINNKERLIGHKTFIPAVLLLDSFNKEFFDINFFNELNNVLKKIKITNKLKYYLKI